MPLESARLCPEKSFRVGSIWVPVARPRRGSILSLAQDAIVVWDEWEQIAGAAERLWKRLLAPEKPTSYPPEKGFFTWEELRDSSSGRASVIVRELDLITDPLAQPLHISTRPSMTFHGNIQVAVSEARSIVENGGRAAFFAPSNGELERLSDILSEYKVPFQLGLDTSETTAPYLAERAYLAGAVASTYLIKGRVERGVTFTDSKLTMFGSEDLFDTSALIAQPASTRSAAAAFQQDIADLKTGDYVVHTQHGVGRFLGIRTIAQGEQAGDFMVLEYANEAKLYVPLTRMDLVQKFRGRGRSARRRSTGWAELPGTRRSRALKPRCATWRTSC